MKHLKLANFFLICSISYLSPFSVTITPQKARDIGFKIWNNECAKKVEGLTSWNEGEEFASLGIGHSIWYPAGKKGAFDESFPSVMYFLKQHGKRLPTWLDKALKTGCPWKTRAIFLAEQSSPHMIELRKLLVDTIDQQIGYIVRRLKKSFPTLLTHLSVSARSAVRHQFDRLSKTNNGLYALIDYINFKGEGINPREIYNGHRWGLLCVLEQMKGTLEGMVAVEEFVAVAKKVLQNRVNNAPAGRNEARWLPGWNSRLDSYLKPF